MSTEHAIGVVGGYVFLCGIFSLAICITFFKIDEFINPPHRSVIIMQKTTTNNEK